GSGSDPRGDERPRDLRLPPLVGNGEPDLPRRLQPQAHSAGDAATRLDARSARTPAPWPTASRSHPAAGLAPKLVLGCLPDPVLERRSPVGRLRDRLSRPGGVRLDRLAAPADGRGHSYADGQSALR